MRPSILQRPFRELAFQFILDGVAWWFSAMLFNSERWNSIDWQFCHLLKVLYFWNIFTYIIEMVVTPTSRIAVIINWSNPCGTIDNAALRLLLSVFLMPIDIIGLSCFVSWKFSLHCISFYKPYILRLLKTHYKNPDFWKYGYTHPTPRKHSS